jgi:hypothetical protein
MFTETVWRYFKKLKIEKPCDLAIYFLNIYPKQFTSVGQIDICTPRITVELFTIAKMLKKKRKFQNV